MPASSTARRSWISPQRPRTVGDRSARARLPVWSSSRCCAACSPLHLLHQPAVGLGPLALQLLDLAVDLVQRLLHRRHQPFDRLLARLQRGIALLPGALQLLIGQREESLVVGRQRLGRQRFEGIAQPPLGLAQQLALLVQPQPQLRRVRLGDGALPVGRPRLLFQVIQALEGRGQLAAQLVRRGLLRPGLAFQARQAFQAARPRPGRPQHESEPPPQRAPSDREQRQHQRRACHGPLPYPNVQVAGK